MSSHEPAINLAEKLSLINDHWNPRIIGELNGQYLKLVKFAGPFTWHHHDHEDELFLVLHLMIAGRLHWKEAGAKLPGKIGLAALDFSTGTLTLTEAGSKRRAASQALHGVEAVGDEPEFGDGIHRRHDADIAGSASVIIFAAIHHGPPRSGPAQPPRKSAAAAADDRCGQAPGAASEHGAVGADKSVALGRFDELEQRSEYIVRNILEKAVADRPGRSASHSWAFTTSASGGTSSAEAPA